MKRTSILFAGLMASAGLVIAGAASAQELTGTLKKIKDSGSISVGHRDASHGPLAGAIMLRYAWAPFLQNATAAVDGWGGAGGAGRAPPTLALFSQSLWHMLHDGDAGEGYAAGLADLAGALEAAAARGAAPADGVAVASVPSVAHARLSAADKKATMTPARVDSFNRALDAVFGGGRVPGAALVDARRVTGAAASGRPWPKGRPRRR